MILQAERETRHLPSHTGYGANLDTAVNIERSDGSLRLSDIRDSNEMALEDGHWATNLIGKPYPNPEYPLTVSERIPFNFKKTLDILNWPASLFNVYQPGDIRFLESSDSIGEFVYYSENPRYLIALSGFTNNMLQPVDCGSIIADCSLSVIDMFYVENGGGGDDLLDPTAINQVNTLKGEAESCNGCLPNSVIYALSYRVYRGGEPFT